MGVCECGGYCIPTCTTETPTRPPCVYRRSPGLGPPFNAHSYPLFEGRNWFFTDFPVCYPKPGQNTPLPPLQCPHGPAPGSESPTT